MRSTRSSVAIGRGLSDCYIPTFTGRPRWKSGLHGVGEVIEQLANDPPPAPPAYHELCDGLMYRWIDCPG